MSNGLERGWRITWDSITSIGGLIDRCKAELVWRDRRKALLSHAGGDIQIPNERYQEEARQAVLKAIDLGIHPTPALPSDPITFNALEQICKSILDVAMAKAEWEALAPARAYNDKRNLDERKKWEGEEAQCNDRELFGKTRTPDWPALLADPAWPNLLAEYRAGICTHDEFLRLGNRLWVTYGLGNGNESSLRRILARMSTGLEPLPTFEELGFAAEKMFVPLVPNGQPATRRPGEAIAPVVTADDPKPMIIDHLPCQSDRSRRGRMPKAESEAKRAKWLATLNEHPTLKDDAARLAAMVGVSESTARRWLDEQEAKYLRSRSANTAED